MLRMPVSKHLLLLGLAVVVSGCQLATDEPFAKVVPSAVIETRDGPTQIEFDRETQVVVLGTGTPIPDAHRAGSGR